MQGSSKHLQKVMGPCNSSSCLVSNACCSTPPSRTSSWNTCLQAVVERILSQARTRLVKLIDDGGSAHGSQTSTTIGQRVDWRTCHHRARYMACKSSINCICPRFTCMHACTPGCMHGQPSHLERDSLARAASQCSRSKARLPAIQSAYACASSPVRPSARASARSASCTRRKLKP